MNQTTHEQPAALSLRGQAILFPKLPYKMFERSSVAVRDEALIDAVQKATLTKDIGRKQIFADDYGTDYGAMRELAGRIKQHTLEHLDHYLNQFIDNAEAAGAQVHFAGDAQQANAICLDIARRANCTRCVKAKSMVTEETHLLPELESIGIKTLETDLGEFILQLDDDAPSHIVTPMIHKDRKAVARAFERELGADYTEDPQQLTRIAREHLREEYRRADLGISGANFMVAESGTLVTCTNEGNGRFCTSAPRVHVAFVGIEKLVPTLSHLSVLLKMLARSSTAQPLTVYTHLMTGPRRSHEHDGPEQMHIILVDNGRSKILADREYRQALRCIRCGACLNACPVYRKVSGHSYGAVYSGPIGSVITPLFKEMANYKDLPNASSLCGACYEACPVKIDLPRLLIKLRRDMVGRRVNSFWERQIFKLYTMSMKYSWMYRMSGVMQRLMLRFQADKEGFVHSAPGPMAGWTDVRDLPAPPRHSFRHWWHHRHESQEDHHG